MIYFVEWILLQKLRQIILYEFALKFRIKIVINENNLFTSLLIMCEMLHARDIVKWKREVDEETDKDEDVLTNNLFMTTSNPTTGF